MNRRILKRRRKRRRASVDTPKSSAEKEADDRITDLMQQLQKARDEKAKVET